MNFMEAMDEIRNGKYVRREAWSTETICCEGGGGLNLAIYDEDGGPDTLIAPSIEDIKATDWYVVEDNWNLAICESFLNGSITIKDVMYCRDLILREMEENMDEYYGKKAQDIVNKRFGDMETNRWVSLKNATFEDNTTKGDD